MKRYASVVIAVSLVALLFMFGCTMPNLPNQQHKKSTPTGYSVSVNPRTIVPGGVSTIKFTIKNSFEKTMKGVSMSVTGVPGEFNVQYNKNIGDIMKGQSMPQIITISAPSSVNIQQVITPQITVCFNYTTDFYQDLVFNSKLSTANVTAHSGSTYGPTTVVVGNSMMYPSASGLGVTSVQVNNAYIGKIHSINKITLTLKKTDFMSSMDFSAFGCKATSTTSNGQLVVTLTNCKNLMNPTIVADGAEGTVNIHFTKSLPKGQYDLETLKGSIEYTYCYNVNVGSITVKPVGQ